MYQERQERDNRKDSDSRKDSDASKVYVGNLPRDIRSRDLEDLFFKYGKIVDVDLHTSRERDPFAFVQFEDPR